jgi:prepilin-type N-terminal cleavage/methylation domain-containing protein
MSRRKAFTLVELLVVILIIGVLITLLLPAVQRARGAAARTKCQDHLKQLGIALHNHENAMGVLPSGGVTSGGQVGSWIHAALPYLEQKDLAKLCDLTSPWFSDSNKTYRETPLAVLRCPSSPNPRVGTMGNAVGAAVSDYKATAGLNSTILGIGLPPETVRQGMMREAVGTTKFLECTDGLSNTFLIAESAGSPQKWIKGQRVMPDVIPDGCWAAKDGVTFQGRSHALDGASSPGPCAVNCSNNRGIYSFHPGVAQVCMGDGSVRVLSDKLNVFVYVALTTIANAEVINANDY